MVNTAKGRERVHWLRRWIRSCGVCASFFPPIDTVCERCWAELDQIQNRGVALSQEGRPFALYSLFTWKEAHGALVGRLVRSLKGGLETEATWDLVERLSLERGFLGGQGVPSAFILPPRHPGRKHDHAWLMAQYLGELWQCPVLDVFEDLSFQRKLGTSEQKHRGVIDRAELRFSLKVNMHERLPRGLLVFVDDVVTSGATAMAAYMALEDPSKFEVWTLANRPKLATSPGL